MTTLPSSGLAHELRTPRAAAVAGIAFAVILTAAIVLMRAAAPPGAAGASVWITSESRRATVSLALTLIPFAGIAFLWFIGVVRTRLGVREDKLFATVFLGSGLLFVSMLFVGAAVLGSLLTLYAQSGTVSSETLQLGGMLAGTLLGTFGTRMAAVFTLSVTSIGFRSGVNPRWLTVVGYVCAIALLVSPPVTRWAQLLFPAWVLLLSINILVASRLATDGADRGVDTPEDGGPA